VLVVSLTLFFLDTRFNYFKPVRSALSTLVYPLQLIASFPSDVGHWYSDYFQTRSEVKERNKILEATNLLNSVRIQRLQALERENMRLHELLGSSFRLPERVLVAELLTIDVDPFSQQVVVNKGERYGVFEGQAVLDSTGVMGQVTQVSEFSSRVILLTDPSHGVPVQINRNGLRAVAIGRGLGKALQLEHLPQNTDVREGDLLVTSGLGGRFPVGYPVGTVGSVSHPQGKAFASITVEPAANLATSREVLLVLPIAQELGGSAINVEPAEPANVESEESSTESEQVDDEELGNGDQ